jgi:hypothetical protein
MIQAKESKPQRLQSEELLLEELPDELMIYDPPRNKAFCLNQTAAFVWRHADGNTTVSEMTALMEQQLGKPVSEQMVWFALDMLSKDGLLASSMTVPEAVVDLSRRKLLQKLGAGALALPVVTVLMVSPAKAHASSTGPSGPPTVPPSSTGTIPSQSSGGFWKWLEDLF